MNQTIRPATAQELEQMYMDWMRIYALLCIRLGVTPYPIHSHRSDADITPKKPWTYSKVHPLDNY